jgi:hypothetical protein
MDVRVVAAAAGKDHSVVLTGAVNWNDVLYCVRSAALGVRWWSSQSRRVYADTGRVMVCGDGDSGQLGVDGALYALQLREVAGFSHVDMAAVAAGATTSFALSGGCMKWNCLTVT